MRPEHDLLLSCVRAAFPNDRTDPPPALPETVDWNRFIGLCDWHNVVPLVYRALPTACPGYPRGGREPSAQPLSQQHGTGAFSSLGALPDPERARLMRHPGIPLQGACPVRDALWRPCSPAVERSRHPGPEGKVRRVIDCLDTLGYGARTSLAGNRLAAHRRTGTASIFPTRRKAHRRAPVGRRPGLFRVRPRKARHLVRPAGAPGLRSCLSRAAAGRDAPAAVGSRRKAPLVQGRMDRRRGRPACVTGAT